MGNTTIVTAVGTAFLDAVREQRPTDADELLREFQQVSSQVSSSLRGPLREWSAKQLAANPKTVWMAKVLREEGASATAAATAQKTLEEMKRANDELADSSVPKGRLYSFSRGEDEAVKLPDVARALAEGPLELHVVEWVRDTTGRFLLSLLLAGTQLWLNDVAVKSMRNLEPIEVESVSDLSAALARSKLA
jgi:hypothetical protein